MKKLFMGFLILALFAVTLISVSAKETVIFEDDFSFDSLYQYDVKGNWYVSNGMLNLGSGSGSAYLHYEIPEQYRNGGYKIEVDFIGHTSTGAIQVGGSGSKLTAEPVNFHGFDCFIGNNGKKGALGCYNEKGDWSGNIFVSGDVVTATDVHLSVEVYGSSLTYRVTSLDGKTEYYSVNYTIGTSNRDIYDAFSGIVGLRKFYVDKGSFDNFKITVYDGTTQQSGGDDTSTEEVIFKDDFSADSLDKYELKGNWNVSNGMLNLGEGSGSAYLYYDIPEQYRNGGYKIEVDFIGHTSTGAIQVGGSGSKLTAEPVNFHGFDCFIGNNGKKGALGCYNEKGDWGGNIFVSGDIITASNIHLIVEVYGNSFTYRVTSLDGKTIYYSVDYTIGTSDRDLYDAFSGRIGLRKFYTDKGSFDNFKVTVFDGESNSTMNDSTVISVTSKETVILEDDFSKDTLGQYKGKGNWNVSDGKLSLGEGSGDAYLIYEFPEQYKGCNYKVEVDFIGHTSTGGIMVGGSASSLSAVPADFYGFDCFIGNNGKKGALGCYNASGTWGGNIIVGDEIVTASDLHLSVEVYDNELTYRITSLDGKTHYYGVNYALGTSSRDVYSSFDSIIGLRKFYTDKGYFDNLKITVYGDEQLPAMDKKIELGGFAFQSSDGLKQENGTVSGSGAMLTETTMADNFKAELTLTPENNTKLLFGMTDEKNGYAFEIDKNNETLAFYKITDGKYTRLGVKKLPVYDGEHAAYVEVKDGVVTVMFDTFFEKEDAFWSFSFKFGNYKTGKFGVMLDGGSVKALTITEVDSITGKTYTNPVNWGADPDVLFYDGTYYLYNRVHADNGIFRVYTSTDMVNWTAGDIVFTIDPAVHTATGYMSPNVTYYNGTFYLFYAAKNSEAKNRLFCATSDSPVGPFTHKHGQVPLHDVSEIGGHPYIDESGKVYLTYARFGNGNHIWIEEVILADDKATPVPGTLTKLISPSTEFENDGYGHIAEGGVLYKHNGYYYMIYATGHYQGHYGETYAISKDILGPYTKYEYGDIITWNMHTDGTGDAIFVKSPDGTELWMVYHRHQTPGQHTSRYTCIDKVKFVADPNGGPDILTVQGPSTTPQAVPSNASETVVKLTIGSTTAYINGVAQTLDAAPINRNNRTMLPVRFLANAFGVTNDGIKWDAATRTATLTNATTTIVVTIDKPTMTVNGETVALDSPAIIESNRTYLPVRAIANALGVSNDNIAWDAATNTATLVK